jgi:formylglycine-generating enzyme required for sulfatase activity
VPAGFAYVPPGRFLFGSADPKLWKSLYQTAPLHRAQTGAYFIAVHETTNAEWIRYLDALPASERARLSTGAQLAKIGDVWTYTLQGLAADREGPRTFREREPVEYERRKSRQRQNWMRLPAAMIAGTDARAYAKWLHESGILPGARLCTDLEWERAARGADARLYTTGDAIGPMDANLVDRYPEAVDERWGADEVGSQPGERSPFGVDDLTGNVMEYVASSLERDAVVARGASWQQRAADAVLVVRWPYSDFRDPRVGVRLCADVPNAEPARLR